MFGRLLGPRSFDNLEGPLASKQTSFPITFGSIKLIPMATIALATYLGSWALVISIIIARFMVDQCPFLLEALAQINNNGLPFQQRFKAACDLLFPLVRRCCPSFE
jgi:hypothetical protein